MFRQQPRISVSCPPGFKGRYTVSTGDTLFTLAQIFRTDLNTLIESNRHITNPNILFPGDVLCVPGLIGIPCCIVLTKASQVPFGSGGAALVDFGPQGGQSVSIHVTLPTPSNFGSYDLYTADVFLKEVGGFGNQLIPVSGIPLLWATRIDLPTVVSLMPDAQIMVRPFNSSSGVSGPALLQGSLAFCGFCTPRS